MATSPAAARTALDITMTAVTYINLTVPPASALATSKVRHAMALLDDIERGWTTTRHEILLSEAAMAAQYLIDALEAEADWPVGNTATVKALAAAYGKATRLTALLQF